VAIMAGHELFTERTWPPSRTWPVALWSRRSWWPMAART